MARPKGLPKTGGRKAGTRNKRTEAVLEILERHDFNPLEEMIELYHLTKNEDSTVGVAQRCLQEIMSYTYPKLKHIEHTGKDGDPIEVHRRLIDLPDVKLVELVPQAIEVLKGKDK